MYTLNIMMNILTEVRENDLDENDDVRSTDSDSTLQSELHFGMHPNHSLSEWVTMNKKLKLNSKFSILISVQT